MRDMIFISLENWDDVWRRNQFLCAQFLRRFPGMRLLFVERARDFTHALRRRNLQPLRLPPLRTLPEFPGLALFRALKCLPNSFAPCRALNSLHFQRQVRAVARWARLRHPLLWINDHFAHPLVGAMGECGVVYDITDDWALMPSIPPAERERIRHADAALCAKADLVVACSEALETSRTSLCRNILRVPNGVDTALFPGQPSPAAPTANDPFSPLPMTHPSRTPLFGYLGTLHGDRLDLDLLEAMAHRMPSARILLCGPDLLTPTEHARLRRHANIEVRPPVHFSQVPALLAQCDVAILPHRCTPFTESLNPIKLWEYLASGKPVAATPVAGFRDFQHLCQLGAGVEGFLEACRRALSEAPSRASLRMEEASRHSWSNRAGKLLEEFAKQGWLEQQPGRMEKTQPQPRVVGRSRPGRLRHRNPRPNVPDGPVVRRVFLRTRVRRSPRLSVPEVTSV